MSLDGSEIRGARNGSLERLEVLKTEDRVHCRECLRHSRPSESYDSCGRMLQGITDEVWKEAKQRISSRLIMYVPVPKGADAVGYLQNRPNSKKEKVTWIARTSTLAERSWSAPSLTSNIKSAMREQGDTQTYME